VIGSSILVGAIVSLAVSTLALFAIGWWKARTTIGRPTRSGVQMAIIGIASAVAGFGIAYLVSGGSAVTPQPSEGFQEVRWAGVEPALLAWRANGTTRLLYH